MMHLRHDHEDIVASNVHSHVGGRHCMELFVLEGSLEEISAFVGKIRATKDTSPSITPCYPLTTSALERTRADSD